MKHLILLALAGLAISACTGSYAPGQMECKAGFCVRLQVQELVRFSAPVTVNIVFRTDEETPQLVVDLESLQPSILVDGPREWNVHTHAQQEMSVESTIRFTEEGLFQIFGTVHDPARGAPVSHSQYILVTRAGGTVYLPGTPLPITPFVVKTAPPFVLNSQGTLIPIPTKAGSPRDAPRPGPALTGTATLSSGERDDLVRSLVNGLAQGGSRDRYIGQSRTVYFPPSGILRFDSASLERCWVYRSGNLTDCNPSEFSDNLQKEQYPWKYAYAIFAVVSINNNRSEVVIQLDEYFGPGAASGMLLTLNRVNGGWRLASSRTLWTS